MLPLWAGGRCTGTSCTPCTTSIRWRASAACTAASYLATSSSCPLPVDPLCAMRPARGSTLKVRKTRKRSMMVMTKRRTLHDQEKWACPWLRLMIVKMIHGNKHIPKSQVSVCARACVGAHTYTTSAPSQHIIIHYQKNDACGHCGREAGVPEHPPRHVLHCLEGGRQQPVPRPCT
jgi:hypothetical protein